MTNWNINKEDKEDKELNNIQFTDLNKAEKKRGLKILSYGNFSTGKTHFSLSSPQPIFILDTENGAIPLSKNFKDSNIKILNICAKAGELADEKDEVQNFDKFQKAVDYLINLPDDQVGTIVVDSITDIWSWAQAYAKTKIFKIPVENRFNNQFDWGVPNALFRNQILKLINKNCNLILTAREGEVYEGAGKPSGRFTPQVQKRTPYFVDIVLYHRMTYMKGVVNFQATIEKCRFNGKIIGKTIENPSIDKLNEELNGKNKTTN